MRWPSSTPAGMRTLTDAHLVLLPRPVAHGAGRVEQRPAAHAVRADRAEGEQPLVVVEAPRPPATRAGVRRRARRRTAAAAVRAAHLLGHVDRRRDAVHRVLERQVELRLHVGAALRPALGRARPAAASTEETPEEVAQVAHVLHAEGATATATGDATEAADRPAGADLVVLLALLGVADDVVGGADLLEALLRAGVGVRVVLLRQLPVGARDLLLRRRRDDAEHLVVVLLEPFPLCGHESAHPRTRTMAGRSTCPFQR